MKLMISTLKGVNMGENAKKYSNEKLGRFGQ